MKLQKLLVLFLVTGCVSAPKSSPPVKMIQWVPDATETRSPASDPALEEVKRFYLDSVKHAQVWSQPDMDRFDMVKSDYPEAGGTSFAVGASVLCKLDAAETLKRKKLSGNTPKFWCTREGETKVNKVKFFDSDPNDNKEVFSSAVSSRLFRALGFMGNRVYSVSINCPNCPKNPWDIENTKQALRGRPFSPALLEFKPAGQTIDGEVEGWAWKDLDLIDENLPVEQQAQMRTQRGALKLLAAFVQHSDNKAEQQSLFCAGDIEKINGKSFCKNPIMYVHDVGATWGGGGVFTTGGAKMAFNNFIESCYWEDVDSTHPKPRLGSSFRGSLKGGELKNISEESRLFLAELLKEFGSRPERVKAMFDVAQVDQLYAKSKEKITSDHWVAAFNIKVNELQAKKCFKEQREALSKAAKNGQPYSVSIQ